jgi:hypothetical protein
LRSKAEVSPVRTARGSHVVEALLEELVADPGERLLQVLLDVVRERLQRRDVEDVDLVEALVRTLDDQVIDCEREGGSVLPEPVGPRSGVAVLGRDGLGAKLGLGGRAKRF